MLEIFHKQYTVQKTIKNYDTGCKKHTIHYFLSHIDKDGNVTIKIVRDEGEYDKLIKKVLKKYKCVYIILDIPLLTDINESNETSIIEHIEDNDEWI